MNLSNVWCDVYASPQESVDLGEIMYSLCYLPTAGRMTLTVIKCRNLKAMDITGASGECRWGSHTSWWSVLNHQFFIFWRKDESRHRRCVFKVWTITEEFASLDPYVKVSLICDGRRLKKRKTTTKKGTLNPVYNEAIIFDIPPENVEQVSLSIVVMDYDRWVVSVYRSS